MKILGNVISMKIIYKNIFGYLFVTWLVIMPIAILAAEDTNQATNSQGTNSTSTTKSNPANTTVSPSTIPASPTTLPNTAKATTTPSAAATVTNSNSANTQADLKQSTTSAPTKEVPNSNNQPSQSAGYRQFNNPNAKVQQPSTQAQPPKQPTNPATSQTTSTLNQTAKPQVTNSNNNSNVTPKGHANPNNTNAEIENFTANKAKSILNSIDKNYSFLYDPTMDNSLMVDILQNPQNYVVLFLDQNRQELGTAVLIKVLVNENPAAANTFLSFVRQGLYDNIKIFRLIPNYFLQTGDPSNSGYGGTGVLRPASIKKNLRFKRGTVAFSNLNNLDSDDSQFFITFNGFPWLDNKYSIFGTVIYGMDLLEGLRGTYNNDGFVLQGSVIYKAVVLADLQGAGTELFKDYPEAVANAQQKAKGAPVPKAPSATEETEPKNSKYTSENNN